VPKFQALPIFRLAAVVGGRLACHLRILLAVAGLMLMPTPLFQLRITARLKDPAETTLETTFHRRLKIFAQPFP
jgi:hypothetical protein